jgi:hypothetical protein
VIAEACKKDFQQICQVYWRGRSDADREKHMILITRIIMLYCVAQSYYQAQYPPLSENSTAKMYFGGLLVDGIRGHLFRLSCCLATLTTHKLFYFLRGSSSPEGLLRSTVTICPLFCWSGTGRMCEMERDAKEWRAQEFNLLAAPRWSIALADSTCWVQSI